MALWDVINTRRGLYKHGLRSYGVLQDSYRLLIPKRAVKHAYKVLAIYSE